jgi:hypothetical protein
VGLVRCQDISYPLEFVDEVCLCTLVAHLLDVSSV